MTTIINNTPTKKCTTKKRPHWCRITDCNYCPHYVEVQSSLPSNLEDAAEEFAYTNWEDNDYHEGANKGLPFDAIEHTKKAFKAGAQWMAIQKN